MTKKDALNILDLPENADRAQIRHAYSEKSKIYHVETHPEEFKRLHEAYKTALAQTDRSGNTVLTRTIPPTDTDNAVLINYTAGTAYGTAAAAKEPPAEPEMSHNDILDTLIQDSFSISRCPDITRLIYHKCRYEESLLTDTGAAPGGVLTKKTVAWQDPPADGQLFYGIPWSVWKAQDWTALICHPEFLRRQYTSAFLDELCYLLQEEGLYGPEGIGQDFYSSLCIAYGFFQDGMDGMDLEDSYLQELEDILRSHPKYRKYVFDLYNRDSAQEARDIVLFCQKGLTLSDEEAIWDFLNTAEEMLLPETDPSGILTLRDRNWEAYEPASCRKQFILRNLMDQSGSLFDRGLSRLRELQETQRKYAEAFIENVLSHTDTCDTTLPSGECPSLSCLLGRFRQQYLNRDNWRELICRPVFLQAIKKYILSQDNGNGNGYPSVRFVPYETWRQLRIWFNGTSPFLAEATRWLKTSYYFSEYEKRYQKERFWKAIRVKESFFEEILPIPRPDHEKRKLLRAVRKGIPSDAARIQSAFLRPLLANEKLRIPFLTRLAYNMVHFRFLQYTPADSLSGGTFCFLKKEVILYQRKDNLVCHLGHETFYDILSKYFDRIVYNWMPSKDDKKIYSEEFLDTACRNLYCYECFVHSRLDK